jgi:diguanylate cyclase (GGDEF)-like protein/PAS domain S-box-containing protein
VDHLAAAGDVMKPLFEDRTRMLLREAPGSRPKADAGRRVWREGRPNGDRARRKQHFRHVAAGAFEATLSGEITDANSTLAKLLGFASRQDLVGTSLAELLADPATLDRVLGHAREGQELTGEEVPLRTTRGEELVVLLCTKLMGPAGETGRRVVGTLMDITERKRRESDLERLAFEDPLTGVANRRALDEHAGKYLALAERRGTLVGLIYLDLTRFKAINDGYGHAAGDAVLTEVARRLEATARTSDVVSRVGGDEFVVLLPDVDDLEAVVTAARRMKTKLEGSPVELEDTRMTVRAEVGVSLYPEHGSNLDDLVRAADQAMYRAKESNGDGEPHEDDGQTARPPVVVATEDRPSPRRGRS